MRNNNIQLVQYVKADKKAKLWNDQRSTRFIGERAGNVNQYCARTAHQIIHVNSKVRTVRLLIYLNRKNK